VALTVRLAVDQSVLSLVGDLTGLVAVAVVLVAVVMAAGRRSGLSVPGSAGDLRRSLGLRARPWESVGVQAHEAAEFEAAFGPAPEGVDLLREWTTVLRATNHVALEWRRVPGNDSPSFAALWRNTGFEPASAADWIRDLWSPADAWSWSCRGTVSCRDATDWRAAGGEHLSPIVLASWSLPEFTGRMAVAYAWCAKGVTPIEARLWQMSVGDHSVSAQWITEGFRPESARKWSEIGFSVVDAVAMRERGLHPEDVSGWEPWLDDPVRIHEWRSAGAPVLRVAEDYIDHGFDPESASSWLAVRMGGAEARGWESRGFDAESASAWRSHMDPMSARTWRPTGLAPGTAARWSGLGFSVGDTMRWVGAGFTDPNVALMLTRDSCDPSEARAWVEAGVDAESVPRLRREWTVEDYRAWVAAGFRELAGAREWRSARFEPAEAGEWNRHGATPALAVELRASGLAPSDIRAISSICEAEGVQTAEAVWRHSIIRAGFSRRGGVPLHDPENGRGRREDLVRFVHATIASRCPEALVFHDAPFLTRAMSEALPEARPVRGATKHWIWSMEAQLDGITITDADERHLLLTVRVRGGRRRIFSEEVRV